MGYEEVEITLLSQPEFLFSIESFIYLIEDFGNDKVKEIEKGAKGFWVI